MNRKHILIILSILLLLPWGGYGAKAKKAVFIIVDGVPADMIERLKPPAIGRIAAEGGYSRAYCGGSPARTAKRRPFRLSGTTAS